METAPLPTNDPASSLRRQPSPTVVEVEPETVARWVADGEALLVDVRESEEYAEERIPGALLLPFSTFDERSFPQVPCKKVVLVCLSGKRSAKAGARLAENGRPTHALKGGMLAWSAAGYATVAAAA